ncbi:hypothetical protein F441_16636 [Phytophthora nicotianae CJ01A1]|uniref:Uncharacterized protein n=3 Tax=Phytophthora nicotianae TaxID=4792 RepID=V9EDJ0_PHYNI|nr:hypothetical protein F443_16801 [Phytophthora nicotianae P1569]ETK77400.1 hypothetical protein L915_16335 [Phytophthora nicotianae]ETL30841.1 hypothetical protein L916_16230 [Phytophthora nicotianae]ETP07041.1 hypothetical protein F441_16636 [Phytophthora nicotianae CJ01A1]
MSMQTSVNWHWRHEAFVWWAHGEQSFVHAMMDGCRQSESVCFKGTSTCGNVASTNVACEVLMKHLGSRRPVDEAHLARVASK